MRGLGPVLAEYGACPHSSLLAQDPTNQPF